MQINVTQWLDETARVYENKAALVDENGQVTFGQWRKMAQAIAAKVLQIQPESGKPVAVYMEKSTGVLVCFAGIAYAGDFYSPIDVTMPSSRVQKILEILEPEIIITTRELQAGLAEFGYDGEVIIYDDVTPAPDDEANVAKATAQILDTDLLYVLFTSGSTGVPKGVGIRHRSVIDYTDWVTSQFEVTSEDAFGNQAPFYFDNSILDIYSCMKTGATLYIIPSALFSQPVPLLEYIKENDINTIFWVPSALIAVAKLRALKNVDMSSVLKRILFCGEVMPNKQLNYWRSFIPNAVYANLYGPTEITDACTFYIVDREFDDDETLPIGGPMPNTRILLLDDEDKLITEPGIVGELCVQGTSLAVGYYGNPEKTDAAFVQNPLNTVYEEKIYRTGDLVSYNERGEILYSCRKDFQIKHLGHRIELGEIETAASSLDEIPRCCCIYDEKHSRIVLIVESETAIEKAWVSEKLKTMVPEYMIPGKVVNVPVMPLNANGKIDRVKLKENL